MEQETLVLVKPDGVSRNLIGAIIERFEGAGLKVVGLKLVKATKAMTERHYPLVKEWAVNVGRKSRESYEKRGIKVKETDYEIGERVHSWLGKMLMSGPIVAIVLRGDNAVEIVRKLIGSTEAKSAAPGTIRGDFGTDSYADSDREKRALWNLVHASESEKDAEREIAVWFREVAEN
jgi:nucleoside-diphosphate kinase